jgi:hypothetical protein
MQAVFAPQIGEEVERIKKGSTKYQFELGCASKRMAIRVFLLAWYGPPPKNAINQMFGNFR